MASLGLNDLMGCPFSDLWASGCCCSINALLYLFFAEELDNGCDDVIGSDDEEIKPVKRRIKAKANGRFTAFYYVSEIVPLLNFLYYLIAA